MKRPQLLRLWMDALGKDFVPKKSHVICSAHFLPADIMERANASGVMLKNAAVPSIFLEAASIESGTYLKMECDTSPVMESATDPFMECGTAPVLKSDADPAMECSTSTSAAKTVPALITRSILKPKKDNAFLTSVPLLRTQGANDTLKMIMKKKRNIMNNSIVKLKQQEMSPRERSMLRTIKTLKQKLKRKQDKITLLESCLETSW